jgi:hypothetical protein
MNNSLGHDPEKACPGLDPGWEPVFGQDHAENEESSARRRQPGVAYGTPSSNFRSRRRARAPAARAGWGRRYIICCTAVEMFGQALLARSTIAR